VTTTRCRRHTRLGGRLQVRMTLQDLTDLHKFAKRARMTTAQFTRTALYAAIANRKKRR
jgi:hypothetical protein